MQVTTFGNRSGTVIADEIGKEAALNPANSGEQKLAEVIATRSRIPMSAPRAKLATPEIPGHHTHWLNDYAGRLLQAQQGGYDFVDQSEVVVTSSDLAGSSLGVGSDMGSRVSVVVGKNEDGTPLRAYLMKIRNEWFEADQEASQTRVDQMHDAMKQGKQESGGDNSNRYVKSVNMKSTYSRRG